MAAMEGCCGQQAHSDVKPGRLLPIWFHCEGSEWEVIRGIWNQGALTMPLGYPRGSGVRNWSSDISRRRRGFLIWKSYQSCSDFIFMKLLGRIWAWRYHGNRELIWKEFNLQMNHWHLWYLRCHQVSHVHLPIGDRMSYGFVGCDNRNCRRLELSFEF